MVAEGLAYLILLLRLEEA